MSSSREKWHSCGWGSSAAPPAADCEGGTNTEPPTGGVGGGGTLFWKERVSITQWEWVCVGVFVFDTRVKLKLRTKRSSFHQFYPQSSANHSGVQQRCVSEAEFKGCAFLRHTRSSREGARRGERRGSEVQRDFVKQRGDKNVSPRLLRYLPHGGAAEHGRLPHSLRYGRNRLKK